jgi:hypothetical protein
MHIVLKKQTNEYERERVVRGRPATAATEKNPIPNPYPYVLRF